MWPFGKKDKKKEGPVIIIKDCSVYCRDGYLPGEEKRCPRWVIMKRTYLIDGKSQENCEGRCAIAWIPDILIELKDALLSKKE